MTSAMIAEFKRKDVRAWRNDISEAVRQCGVARHYERKQVIFHQGMPAHAVYAVESGVIETSGVNAAGREVTLSIRGPREAFGYSEAVLSELRTRQASVLQDARIWEVRTDVFLDLLSTRPDITLAMLGSVLSRTTRSSSMRADLRGTSAHERVGYVLHELARGTRELAEAETPQLRITHEEISRVCDLSRQTVTTILGTMQANRVVELGLRSVRVLDRRRLCQDVEPAGID